MATPSSDAPKPSPGNTNTGTKSNMKYEYMFEKDRSPTKQLDALLRAIAKHVVRHIGDCNDKELTPKKLAAFYKAVGGDYDSLFVQMDNQSISYIWQITGCQHTLQPTESDFEPPSVPALTLRGFSRWEALEILLGPEEHVPFLQFAVRNWNLRHPETGELFPHDLPRNVFPEHADPEVDRWHEACADRLWKEAGTKEDKEPKAPKAEPAPPPETSEPKFAYVHVNVNPFGPGSSGPAPRQHTRPEQRARPFSYVHVPGRNTGHPGQRMSTRSPERSAPREPSHDERGRRRSWSDFPSPGPDRSPPHAHSHSGVHLDPNVGRPTQPRRHSHPRQFDSDDSEEELDSPHVRRRTRVSPPAASRGARFAPPSAPQPPPAVNNGNLRSHRSDTRDDLKRRSGNSPLGSFRDKVTEKVTGLFGAGSARPPERPRTESRQNSYVDSPRSRRSPAQPVPPPRYARAYSDSASEDSSDPESSGDELRRRRRAREADRDRDRDRHRDRGRPSYELDHELDDDLDPVRRHRQYLRRPESYSRRPSSHADAERRREQAREQAAFDSRGRGRPRDDRARFERRSPEERGSPSPMMGVSGRRYPDAVYT